MVEELLFCCLQFEIAPSGVAGLRVATHVCTPTYTATTILYTEIGICIHACSSGLDLYVKLSSLAFFLQHNATQLLTTFFTLLVRNLCVRHACHCSLYFTEIGWIICRPVVTSTIAMYILYSCIYVRM